MRNRDGGKNPLCKSHLIYLSSLRTQSYHIKCSLQGMEHFSFGPPHGALSSPFLKYSIIKETWVPRNGFWIASLITSSRDEVSLSLLRDGSAFTFYFTDSSGSRQLSIWTLALSTVCVTWGKFINFSEPYISWQKCEGSHLYGRVVMIIWLVTYIRTLSLLHWSFSWSTRETDLSIKQYKWQKESNLKGFQGRGSNVLGVMCEPHP